jgi:hypothetical protein
VLVGVAAGSVLVLVTLALYWPATGCDFIVIDDAFNVTANVPVQNGLTWEGVKLFFFNPWTPPGWTPMTMLSHMVVSQVCGMNPWGHHLGNVLVHALNAALVFAWLRLMTGATWRSLLVATLFAVHPLRVEPVLWVTERREVLCAFFDYKETFSLQSDRAEGHHFLSRSRDRFDVI